MTIIGTPQEFFLFLLSFSLFHFSFFPFLSFLSLFLLSFSFPPSLPSFCPSFLSTSLSFHPSLPSFFQETGVGRMGRDLKMRRAQMLDSK